MPHPGRNLHIDNIKAVLIFLVVFGHIIELNIANDSATKSIWIFIYSFHMPMFALVSGILSKAVLTENQSSQMVRNIIVPLVAFEVLYECLEYFISGKTSNYFSLFAPYWLLWYLLSLLCWRLMLSVFSRMRFPLTIAITLALILSYADNTGYYLSISRTLTFFPFFFLGWKLGTGFLATADKRMMTLNAGVLMGALAIAFTAHSWDYRWLYGSYSLASLDMANPTGLAYQLLLFVMSTVIGLSFINLITRRDIGIAAMGQNSMFIYLWHGFAVIALSKSGLLDDIFRLNSALSMGIIALITFAIMIVASHSWCIFLTRKCILDPLASLFLKRADTERTAAPVQPMKTQLTPPSS
ncbi:MAG: acyltransferase family protein [Pseudomonadota bacterium]